jgi:hypothetical protein
MEKANVEVRNSNSKFRKSPSKNFEVLHNLEEVLGFKTVVQKPITVFLIYKIWP